MIFLNYTSQWMERIRGDVILYWVARFAVVQAPGARGITPPLPSVL